MRTIKFRALVKYPDARTENKLFWEYYSTFDQPSWLEYEVLVKDEQFTGLLDSRGVEIFEGDILDAWSQGRNLIGVVKWGNAGFFLQVPPPISVWSLSGPIDPGEVIGNIHENSDLLEAVK